MQKIKIVTFGLILEQIFKKMNMLKKLLFAIVLISFTIQSQTYVKGSLKPINEKYKWVILYQLKGAKQLYVANVDVVNGNFKIDFPEKATPGMYRLAYDLENRGFVDFIYNNENIELEFNPLNPSGTVHILTSEENKTYQLYEVESSIIKHHLDSLQMSVFSIEDAQKETLNGIYTKTASYYKDFQNYYEKKSTGKLANHFIKSSYKYYAENLIQTPQEYLNSEKQHYFDFINFEDNELMNSTFISRKIVDYVFYLNGSDDVQVQDVLYKRAVQDVMLKIGKNEQLKGELLITLLYTFAQIENSNLVDFMTTSYSDKFNETILKDIKSKMKLAVGSIAPDFSWEEKGVTKKLSELTISEKYVLVFWSTSCSHCLVEVPQLYEFIKDFNDVHVIAFALENDEIDFNIHTKDFTKFTNILGLEKWQNKIARMYEIISTPTYFILDKNKRIIVKPEHFNDVKAYFEN